MRKAIILLLLSLLIATGCSVNPVTGQREFVMMSTAQEIEMGNRITRPCSNHRAAFTILIRN
jgi:hypothetical protein